MEKNNTIIFYGNGCWVLMRSAIKKTWTTCEYIDMFKKLGILTHINVSKLGLIDEYKNRNKCFM